MDDAAFQWDDAKASRNEALHGASFAMAREAFSDPFALDRRDERYAYGEDRYITIGIARGRLLYVA